MSIIVEFFTNNGLDHKGRSLQNMLDIPDIALEQTHDVIQWMFPLHEVSMHSKTAPVLNQEDIETLSKSAIAKHNMNKCLDRFSLFLNLKATAINGPVMWPWCHNGNHNLLRITRAIRSLRLFGLESESQSFYDKVKKIAELKKINKTTLEFWENALKEDLNKSMLEKFFSNVEIKLDEE